MTSLPARTWLQQDRGTLATDLVLLSLLAALSFYACGLGFVGSDDAGYIQAARRWVHAIPPVSNFFGDLRYPAILPIAPSIMLFGDNEFSVAVPSLIYAWGAVVVMYLGMRSISDRATGLIAAGLLSISPLLAGWSTTACVDVCELFFVLASLFTFFHATRSHGAWPIFFVSGVAAGLALMSRESSAALLVFYAILFFTDYGGRRQMFFVMAAGFASVFALEIASYTFALGDPLHRFRLVFAALNKPDPIRAVGSVDLTTERVYNISPLLDPILYSLTHPQFALVFVFAYVAAASVALRRTSIAGPAMALFRDWGLMTLLSFLVSAYVLSHLALQARYFLVPLSCAMVVVAIWLRHSQWLQNRWARIAAGAILVLAAVFGQMIPNKSPLFAEHVLASAAATSYEPIHTDPETKFRGKVFYAWANVETKISAAPPRPGDLFLFNPKFAERRTPRNRDVNMADYRPRKSWVAQQTFVEPHTLLARVVILLHLDALLPATLAQRIVQPNPPVTLYRVGTGKE